MILHRLSHLLRHYPLSLLCTAVIWAGCLAPLPAHTMPTFKWSDKAVHALIYFVLCICIRLEHWRSHRGRPHTVETTRKLWIWAVAAPILMSGLIELAQEFLTTNRSGDWADFAANSLGCLIAAAAFKLIFNQKKGFNERIILRTHKQKKQPDVPNIPHLHPHFCR